MNQVLQAAFNVAEMWAHAAYLRSCALKQMPGDVEEAIVNCMFFLWAAGVATCEI